MSKESVDRDERDELFDASVIATPRSGVPGSRLTSSEWDQLTAARHGPKPVPTGGHGAILDVTSFTEAAEVPRSMWDRLTKKDANARPIVNLPRGSDGLFVEPDKLTPDVQRMLDHNRERFASHFNYADEYGSGNPNSYDPQGDYNCGRCNQADSRDCLLVDIKSINRAAGSCKDWESIRAGDPEMKLKRMSPEVAVYGVAANGKGFGCARCPFSKPAKNADDRGRIHWCGEGGFHQTPTACCAVNGAATL